MKMMATSVTQNTGDAEFRAPGSLSQSVERGRGESTTGSTPGTPVGTWF
uniref:Uncharacterized protein n=1 Tax=Arundo donax TaxID=35708 RepID=A0A0A8ZVD4_ARUDO